VREAGPLPGTGFEAERAAYLFLYSQPAILSIIVETWLEGFF
jgi:hypothetical protein